MLNYVESLEYISSAAARVAPDLLKALKILSETTVRRSAVDREDLKIRKISPLYYSVYLFNFF